MATLRFDFTAYKGYPYEPLARSMAQRTMKKEADGKYSMSAFSKMPATE